MTLRRLGGESARRGIAPARDTAPKMRGGRREMRRPCRLRLRPYPEMRAGASESRSSGKRLHRKVMKRKERETTDRSVVSLLRLMPFVISVSDLLLRALCSAHFLSRGASRVMYFGRGVTAALVAGVYHRSSLRTMDAPFAARAIAAMPFFAASLER